MKTVGTIARGIRTPIIKKGDDLANIVVDSVLKASNQAQFDIQHQDIIAVTEAVVGISTGNYATIDQIAEDMILKYGKGHLGIVFPILSRNRFATLLKAFALASKKITLLLSYPADEVGNDIMDESILKSLGMNPYHDIITEQMYQTHFSNFRHMFTGVNMVAYYKKIIEDAGCEANFVFSNHAVDILKYTNHVLVANIHKRKQTKLEFISDKNNIVYGLDDILNAPIGDSGFNQTYGLLGSNAATDTKVKLFPNDSMPIVLSIQEKIKQATGKHVEVMIYGDGAFKDPSSGIWELADPVVSPYYTQGLAGSPNELKLKLLVDTKLSGLSGDALNQAVKDAIKHKGIDLKGQDVSLGTTPRKYVDLIGSLCDLVSGSGDKGTPVVYIQNYFTNYTDQ